MAAPPSAPRSDAALVPRRDDFGVVLAALVLLTVLAFAWRAGAIPFLGGSTSSAASANPAGGNADAGENGGRGAGGTAGGSGTQESPRGDTETVDAQTAAMQRLVDLGYPVYCGGGTKPLVALTFDDGPGLNSRAAMDILREAGARATFFLVGKLLGEAQFEGIPSDEARFGAAFGDHSWSHVNMTGLSDEQLDVEIGKTKHDIERLTGERVWMFRPPLGAHDERVDAAIQRYGMFPLLWTVDSLDSRKGTGADGVLANVVDGLRPGAIILLHEGRGTTMNALPQILDEIAARGYQTVTVPELLAQDPPSRQQLKAHACG